MRAARSHRRALVVAIALIAAIFAVVPAPVMANGSAPTITSVTRSLLTFGQSPTNVNQVSPLATGSVSGGDVLIITGTGFESPTVVKVGGTNAPDVIWESSTRIRALTPSGTPGSAVDVTVTNPDGLSDSKTAAFVYVREPERVSMQLWPNGVSFSNGLAISPDGKWIYVAHNDSRISVFNAHPSPFIDTPTLVETMTLGPNVPTQQIVFDSSGSRAYVLRSNDACFRAIDISGNSRFVNDTVTIPGLRSIATSSNANSIYGSIHGTSPNPSYIFEFETNTGTVIDSVTVSSLPDYIALHPGGRYLYVLSLAAATVTIVDVSETLTVVETISVTANPSRIAFSLDGQKAFVTHTDSSNATLDGSVTVLELTGGLPTSPTYKSTIAGLTDAHAIATTPDGKHVYVTSRTRHVFWKIDVATGQVIDAIGTRWDGGDGDTLLGIVVSPNGNSVYLIHNDDTELYVFRNPPSITSVWPQFSPTTGGESVTITGFGFDSATAVTFGGVAAASFRVDSATQITAITPAVAHSTIDVVVTGPGGSDTKTTALMFADTPTITTVSPSTGSTSGGTSVTIRGTNFFDGAHAISFGGTAATSYTVDSATQITAIAPAGTAGAVSIVIAGPVGSFTKTAAFTYIAPTPPSTPTPVAASAGPVATLTSITPSTGPTSGGTQVTITGSNLGSVNGVTFNGNAATSLTVVDSTRITAVTPAGVAGPASVMLSLPGSTASFGAVFTYVAATPPTTDTGTSGGSTASSATATTGGSATTTSSVVRTGAALATFATKSSLLSAADRKAIQRLVTTSGMDARYRIKGYSTTSASAQTLARARARAIQRLLIELGVAYSRISTEFNSKVAKQVQLVALTDR